MTKENDKPNCYDCLHRGTIPGSAHSCCRHPSIGDSDDPLMNAIAILASVGRTDPVLSEARTELNIQANPHGVNQGWFNWPWNFDPTWLINCDGFKPKKEKEKA